MKEKILIAEDEKELAKAVRAILQFSGYDVEVTNNGKEALEKSNEKTYDVIILDLIIN